MTLQFNRFGRALFLLYPLLCTASALPQSIWNVHIDNDPAPAPQDGPSQSASATRDKALIPVQVGSIFAAYLLWIIFISVALLTVGRRLRRSAQTSPRSLAMEIFKPLQPPPSPKEYEPSPVSMVKSNPFDPSPVSPTKKTSHWPSPKIGSGSWGSLRKHKRQDSVQSSVGTFDESVISDDKTRNEIEMDRLYAAVANHEAAKERSQTEGPDPPKSPLAQNPPELQHLRYAPPYQQYPLSPPPDKELYPSSPERQSTTSPRWLNKPSPINITNPPSRNSSRSSFASFASFGKKRNTSIRALPISPPMGSPDLQPNNVYGESEPLTPRHYTPGPPPTPPTRNGALANPQSQDDERRFHFAPSIRSSRSSAMTGGVSPAQTPRTATFPVMPPPPIVEEQAKQPGFAITIDPAPHSRTETPPGTKSRKPAPLNINTRNSSQGTLPLRTAPLPFRSLRSLNSQRPPSTIRATEIVRPDPGRLRAPGSAMPQTPYSPFYMPQTPLTPMTPSRLVTREERKRKEKEEGRRVLTAEDAVQEEGDMWGDAYT